MSASCPNCGNKYGCSCTGGSQKVVASDGTTACSKCVKVYEELLALKNTIKTIKSN